MDIKLKGRILSKWGAGTSGLGAEWEEAEILLTPQELIKQFNWYELINLKLEISDILADKIMKEKILLKQPEPKQEKIEKLENGWNQFVQPLTEKINELIDAIEKLREVER